MTIQYFHRLNILTLSNELTSQLMQAVGAHSKGSEITFDFFCTIDTAHQDLILQCERRLFSGRVMVVSPLVKNWAMISVSTLPEELDDPSLENKLAIAILGALKSIHNPDTLFVQIKPIEKLMR